MKYEIFPTPVWYINEASQELVDQLYKGAYVSKNNVKSNHISNYGGYQSPSFSWENFHPQGIEYINKILSDIFDDFRIQSWWYNINSKGDMNKPHVHPASDYALVWYLTDNEDKLVLMNPNQRILPSYKASQKQMHVTPCANKGDILIFPADIIHYVLPNEKEDDRICISMNISIRDKYC